MNWNSTFKDMLGFLNHLESNINMFGDIANAPTNYRIEIVPNFEGDDREWKIIFSNEGYFVYMNGVIVEQYLREEGKIYTAFPSRMGKPSNE